MRRPNSSEAVSKMSCSKRNAVPKLGLQNIHTKQRSLTMKDPIREINEIPELTMGLDLGDKCSYYCIIDKSGKRVEEGRVRTHRRAMERFFKSQPCKVALQALGHEGMQRR